MHFEGHSASPSPPQDNNRHQHIKPSHPSNVDYGVIVKSLARENARRGAAVSKYERMPASRAGFRLTNFLGLTGKNSIARGVGQMFDPRTRAGLVNIATLFAGGPKEGMDEPLMGRGLQPYNMQKAALSGKLHKAEGVPNTNAIVRIGRQIGHLRNFDKPAQGLYMDSLTRRAQGVGGYRPADPGEVIMQKIEALRKEQSRRSETKQSLQDYSNRTGMIQKLAQEAELRANQEHQLEQALGGHLIPYRGKSYQRPGRPEGDIGSPEAVDMLANYLAHYMNMGKDFNQGSFLAAHDMLFGGQLFKFPGAGPIPPRPFGG